MKKAEHARVKRLPGKFRRCFERRSLFFATGLGRMPRTTVSRIADQGMIDMRKMYADLMRAAGLEPALDQRGERRVARAEGFQYLIARARRLALPAQHCHAFAIERIASEIAFHHATI